jgi:hypothetical protein
MRRSAYIAIAALTTATAACVRTAVDPVTGRMDVDVESPTQQGEEWTVGLEGTGSHASFRGNARARVIAGTTTTTLQVTGGMSGARHPWHIHRGTCATGGPIVGEPSAYPPIVIGTDGSGQQSAQIQLQLNEAERYHLNVHASATDMSTIVACGDLND